MSNSFPLPMRRYILFVLYKGLARAAVWRCVVTDCIRRQVPVIVISIRENSVVDSLRNFAYFLLKCDFEKLDSDLVTYDGTKKSIPYWGKLFVLRRKWFFESIYFSLKCDGENLHYYKLENLSRLNGLTYSFLLCSLMQWSIFPSVHFNHWQDLCIFGFVHYIKSLDKAFSISILYFVPTVQLLNTLP